MKDNTVDIQVDYINKKHKNFKKFLFDNAKYYYFYYQNKLVIIIPSILHRNNLNEYYSFEYYGYKLHMNNIERALEHISYSIQMESFNKKYLKYKYPWKMMDKIDIRKYKLKKLLNYDII